MNTIAAIVAVLIVLVAGAALFYLSTSNHNTAQTSQNTPASNNNSGSTGTSQSGNKATNQTGQVSATTTVPTASITANSTSSSSQAESYIVAVPVNLSQVSAISKFRSCSGHDYSGYDINGSLEANRSMKHYFSPSGPYKYTTGKIEEFAPFNGTISNIQAEQTPIGHQVWVADATSNATESFGGQTYPTPGLWNVIFFHMDLVSGLHVGSRVTAGQLIGYANQSMNEQTFDIGLSKFILVNGSQMQGKQVIDSIFNHMTPQVLAQFAKYGVNQSDIVVAKAYRDANPCDFNMYHPDDWVNLTAP
ncbi:MAG: hypothetical protein KGH98_04260 [Candidatus Micrarchaeota archaeon]|nr:hypothetical protein [Candidatus Micrarchaeota archaeon]